MFKFKRLSMKITFIIGVIILIVAGGVAAYMQFRIITEINRHSELFLQNQLYEIENTSNLVFTNSTQKVKSFNDLVTAVFDMDEFSNDPEGYLEQMNNSIGGFMRNMIGASDYISAAYFTVNPDLLGYPQVFEIYYSQDGDGDDVEYVGELPDYSEFDASDPEMIWFYGAYNSGTPYWTEVYMDAAGVSHTAMVTYAEPVFINGQKIGIVAVDITIDHVENIIRDVQLYETGFAFLEDVHGDFFKTSDVISNLGNAELEIIIDIARANGDDVFEVEISGREYLMAVHRLVNDFNIYVAAPKSEVNAEMSASFKRFIFIFITAYSLVLIAAYFIGKPIGKPLTALSGFMKRAVLRGDLQLSAEDTAAYQYYAQNQTTNDEIGQVAYDFYTLVDVIKTMLDDLSTLSRELNDNGDIDYRINTDKYVGAYKEMADGINNMVSGIFGDITEILRGITALCEGEDAQVRQMSGKKIIFNERFSQFEALLEGFVNELTVTAKNASNGNLEARPVDTAKYKGGWATMLNELNGLVHAVSKPLSEIEKTLTKMSRGEFTQMTGDYKGAFDVVKHAVNETQKITLSYVEEISGLLTAMSKGDLTVMIDHEYIGSYAPIKTALTVILESLNQTMGEINSAAMQVFSGAELISNSSSNLAEGTSKQASSVEELNASIETVSEKIGLSAAKASDANTLSLQSNDHAAHSNEIMKSMASSMEEIKESSENISKIIKVIEDIAFQTNLLALNASVESARAGEHGKGFSVVADEVRNLAAKSHQSAQETATQIEESISRVNDGMDSANKTAVSLDTIVTDVRQISDIISQIAQMSEEQAESIAHITLGINEISSVVQVNSATSEECASTSQELISQAEMLQRMVSFFKLK